MGLLYFYLYGFTRFLRGSPCPYLGFLGVKIRRMKLPRLPLNIPEISASI